MPLNPNKRMPRELWSFSAEADAAAASRATIRTDGPARRSRAQGRAGSGAPGGGSGGDADESVPQYWQPAGAAGASPRKRNPKGRLTPGAGAVEAVATRQSGSHHVDRRGHPSTLAGERALRHLYPKVEQCEARISEAEATMSALIDDLYSHASVFAAAQSSVQQ